MTDLEKIKKRRKIMDVDDDLSQSGESFTTIAASGSSPNRRSKLTTVNSSEGLENQPTVQIAMVSTVLSKMIPTITEFTRETICELEENIVSFENSNESANVNHWTYFKEVNKEMIATNLRRAFKKDKSIFEKRKPSEYESWDREFLFKILKRIAPQASGQSTGIMTVADQIALLKYNFDVFKGTIDCQRYFQRVVNLKLTYKHEIIEQESALVKLLIDNISTESKIQQRLKALVKLQHPKTIDDFGETLLDQVEYLTNVVTEAITNLGMDFTALDKLKAETFSEEDTKSSKMKLCNGCGRNHGGGVCLLSEHPNFNKSSTSWKDSKSGMILAKHGQSYLPWSEYVNSSNELVTWTDAPRKPKPKKKT